MRRVNESVRQVLSEAVDLAGRYGTDESSRFVNGLLAAAADQLRPA